MALHSLMMDRRNDIDIEDINEEINTFLKRKQNVELLSETLVCDKANITDNIKALSEELFLLGIDFKTDSTSDDTVVSLCNIIWMLLTRYRKLNSRAIAFENSIRKIEQQNERMVKSEKKLKNEIEGFKSEIASLHIENSKLKSKINSYTKEISQLKIESDRLRKVCNSVEEKSKKDVKRVEAQMDVLQNKFRGQCGTFVSKEGIENLTIKNLKEKEVKNMEKISELTNENEKLIHEVLSIKENLILLKHENEILKKLKKKCLK